MKKFISAFLALLFFGGVAAQANAASKWEHFNVAPYAPTHDIGMATREKAFGCLGIPQGAIDLLMKETENAGDRTHLLNVGDHLNGMLSTGCKLNRDVTVAFKAPVHNMEYAAPNSRWSVVWEGKRYTVILPDICNNWSDTVETLPSPAPPAPVAEQPEGPCGYLYVSMPYTAQVHSQTAARRPLQHTGCGRGLKFLKGGHGKYRMCDACTMDSSIADLKAKGYLIVRQPGLGFTLTCLNPAGCVMVERLPLSATERTDDDIELDCFSMPDGTRSYVKDIHWRSFKPNPVHNNRLEAYITFAPDQADPDWFKAGGLPHIWHRVPDGQQVVDDPYDDQPGGQTMMETSSDDQSQMAQAPEAPAEPDSYDEGQQ